MITLKAQGPSMQDVITTRHSHETITNVFAVISSSCGLMFSLSYLLVVQALFECSCFWAGTGYDMYLVCKVVSQMQRVCVELVFTGFDLSRLVSGPRDASTQPPGIGIS